jgi:hypothetical protein
MNRIESILAKRIFVVLSLIAAPGWWQFFWRHNLETSAWIGFSSLVFLAFCVGRWGLDVIYLPGAIAGIGLGWAAGLACWKHKLFFVLFCLISVWILANIFWWLISPVPSDHKGT